MNGVTEDEVREVFFNTGDARPVLAARTAEVDRLIGEAFEQRLAPEFPAGVALVAVGGYGRRELFPHSDVDLLLLVEADPATQQQREALAAFLRSLWDRGLRLGHSVHTPRECCSVDDRNIELSISLLDQRLVAGDRGIHASLETELPRFFHSRRQDLINHLTRLTQVRHARYANTIYHLEPNVKECPGGLRDFQLVRWLSQLSGAQSYRMPVAEPMPELEAAWRFLAALRCYLHYRAGRDSNLFSFDLQEEILSQPFATQRDAASWMREYYLSAKAVNRAALRWMEMTEPAGRALLNQFRDWRSRISTSDFTVSRERVLFKSPNMLAHEPELALRAFAFIARHGLRLAADSERRIAEQLPGLSRYFAENPRLWPKLEEILTLPHASLALRQMHETGVLGAWFAEWAAAECLVVRDFYHRYTVDEHTLQAIEAIEDLRRTNDPLRRRFTGLLEEVESLAVLNVTLLFHDLGKAVRSGRHVEESLRIARGALARLDAPEEKARAVLFLIERHLDLSAIMNTRDLDDPATARLLAERTGTEERLKDLTLITYADIDAVHPQAMTPWRLEQLWRLFLVAHNELTRELDSDRIEAPPSNASAEMMAFLTGFPSRYLRVHSEAEIARHMELWRSAEQSGMAIDIQRRNGTYLLTVVATDRPFLLASLAGVLAAFGMNILKAEAFGNRRGMVLDNFVFADPKRTLELNPSEIDRLRLTLERVMAGRADVRRLVEQRRRPAAVPAPLRLKPSVSFNSEATAGSTLIEVVAEDRPGLLYDLARTISEAGCNIELVLLNTEAHKALDVFYVTCNGAKLSASQQAGLKERLLAACRR